MRKDATIILIIGLLALWLLASSIRIVTLPTAPGSPGGGVNVPNIGIPIINITVPHSSTPTIRPINLTLPSVPLPIISIELPIPNITKPLPSINVTMHEPSKVTTINVTGRGSGSGLGSGKVARQSVTTPQIPTVVLLVVLILVMIVSSVFAVLTIRGRGSPRRIESAATVEGPISPIVTQSPLSRPVGIEPMSTEVHLSPGERVAVLSGWGGGRLLSVGIPPDLPLIWGINEPLEYSVKGGASVKVSPGLIIDGNKIIASSEGCHEVMAESSGEYERLVIRFTNYTEDVGKLFRLNVVTRLSNPSNVTPREAIAKLSEEGIIKDRAKALLMVRIFEKAYYGKKIINRSDYESFIKSLAGSHSEPRVIICG